jgi:hypothetical protein
MSNRVTAKLAPAQLLCLLLVALLTVVGLLHITHASGDQLPLRSLTLENGLASTNDNYTLGFTIPVVGTLGSIRLQLCAESPLIGAPCTLPVGMDLTGVTLATQSGETGFSVLSASGTNIILSRLPSAASVGPVGYKLSGIMNPSNPGAYFGRIQTYASTDGTGPSTNYGGLAMDIALSVQVTATVPPYLYFCMGVQITGTDCTTVTGNYLNFGDFNSLTASTAETQMVAGTNADFGYGITVNGTTLTSGVNTIPPVSIPDVSRPGTSQFGMNLRANTDPVVGENPSGGGSGAPTAGYGTVDQYKFNPGDIVASVSAPDLSRKYTATYIANIAKTQPAGIYVSTLTYVATASF